MAGILGHPKTQEEMGDGTSHFGVGCLIPSNARSAQAVTIPTTIGGFVGGISYFGNLEMDPSKPIFVRFS